MAMANLKIMYLVSEVSDKYSFFCLGTVIQERQLDHSLSNTRFMNNANFKNQKVKSWDVFNTVELYIM